MSYGVKIWRKIQKKQNVAQPKKRIQKKKREFSKKYGVYFSDVIVINFYFFA